MISLIVDNGKVTMKGNGKNISVYADELVAISFLRDKLEEQLNMKRETANEMVIAALHLEE